jgi:hypothetical protein
MKGKKGLACALSMGFGRMSSWDPIFAQKVKGR